MTKTEIIVKAHAIASLAAYKAYNNAPNCPMNAAPDAANEAYDKTYARVITLLKRK